MQARRRSYSLNNIIICCTFYSLNFYLVNTTMNWSTISPMGTVFSSLVLMNTYIVKSYRFVIIVNRSVRRTNKANIISEPQALLICKRHWLSHKVKHSESHWSGQCRTLFQFGKVICNNGSDEQIKWNRLAHSPMSQRSSVRASWGTPAWSRVALVFDVLCAHTYCINDCCLARTFNLYWLFI